MVLIILGAISVVALPRLIGPAPFAEAAYQARLVSSLRYTQQLAMQDTDPSHCYRVYVFEGINSSFGNPTDMPDGGCVGGLNFTKADLSQVDIADGLDSGTTQTEMHDAGVSITLNFNGSLTFDSLGRAAECDVVCEITFLGQRNRYVCVEPQGYIRASDNPCA